jgi:hypothetical protein
MNSSVMEQIEKLPPDNSERSGLQNTMDGVIKFSRCMRAVMDNDEHPDGLNCRQIVNEA